MAERGEGVAGGEAPVAAGGYEIAPEYVVRASTFGGRTLLGHEMIGEIRCWIANRRS